jgi:hypothetical protein
MPQPTTPLQPVPIPRAWTSFETMLDEVRLYVPNVADAIALHVVRNSAIDFCRQTCLWLYDFDPVMGIAMQPVYQIDTPDNSVITLASEIWYGERRIDPQSFEQLKKRYVNDFRDITVYNGPPVWYMHEDLCSIRLVPCPATVPADDPDYLTGAVILQPTRDSLGMPAEIAERWMEGIGYGARARLYDTPDTPYFNPGNARIYERKAMNEIGKAKIQANQGRTRGPLMINKRPWPHGG